MIIGGNNPSTNRFENKFKKYKENQKTYDGNIFTQDLDSFKYTSPKNKDEMYEKSLAMLNDRLQKGLITMDEFKKQVNALAKRRK